MNSNCMEEIGRKVRTRRHSLGLSMEKVAAMSGLTYRTILSVEQGKHIMTKVLFAICDALNMEIIIKEKENKLWDF